MTTASRPTFAPAQGGTRKGELSLSAMSKQYSSRDLPSHTKLKYRNTGQATTDDLRGRDFRRDLDDRERTVKDKDKRHAGRTDKDERREKEKLKITGASESKKARVEQPTAPPQNLDADDAVDDDSDESSDDDEDDTAELMAELQRIKAERAADQARKDIEQRQEEERIRMENILGGNPLLAYADRAAKSDLRVKRRWDDDVVFKNCSRSEPDKKERGFINDALRSDFHKKFMEKYIK
uniref:EOG090X0IT3 n=1 Tax=Lynceus sp. MCZ IZ 141354 TaxID=1930659 RepID=A0A9N6ZFV3_9CRUS|nr:EOG090X0IT3 [Lynceus sp. MCZ IZ 141354]